jgi:hypothetical protein
MGGAGMNNCNNPRVDIAMILLSCLCLHGGSLNLNTLPIELFGGAGLREAALTAMAKRAHLLPGAITRTIL